MTGSQESEKNWMALAGRVVENTVEDLPNEIREIAAEIPILLFHELPKRFLDEGLEPDTLGLFEGHDLGETADAGQARIYLFLRNILSISEHDEAIFVEEVRVTLLHELGHLLGLDEEALTVRGLD